MRSAKIFKLTVLLLTAFVLSACGSSYEPEAQTTVVPEVAKAKEAGVTFSKLSDADKKQLVDMIAPVYETWGKKIGMDYFKKVQATLGN